MIANRSTDTVYPHDPATGGSHRNNRICASCGAVADSSDDDRTPTGEILLNAACGVLLIALLYSAVYFLGERLHDRTLHLLHHWEWHEPLDDWNI